MIYVSRVRYFIIRYARNFLKLSERHGLLTSQFLRSLTEIRSSNLSIIRTYCYKSLKQKHVFLNYYSFVQLYLSFLVSTCGKQILRLKIYCLIKYCPLFHIIIIYWLNISRYRPPITGIFKTLSEIKHLKYFYGVLGVELLMNSSVLQLLQFIMNVYVFVEVDHKAHTWRFISFMMLFTSYSWTITEV